MPVKKTKKKKHPKMDRLLVAAKQKHEVKAVAKKTKKSQKAVRAAVKKVGHSRKKVLTELTKSSAISKTFTNDSSTEKIK